MIKSEGRRESEREGERRGPRVQGRATETKRGEYERDHERGLQRKESERERRGTGRGWGIKIKRGRGSREKICHGILVGHSDTIDITDGIADAGRLHIVAFDAACCFCTKEQCSLARQRGVEQHHDLRHAS